MRFFRSVLLAAPLAAACATVPPADARERLRVDGLNVACNASYQRTCGPDGCAMQDELDIAVHVAFSFNGETGEGSLCMATGCHDVFLATLPADAPSPGDDIMAAVLAPGSAETASAGPGPFFDGVVILDRRGEGFQFVQSGTVIWGGRCTPLRAS
ncbi:MAG: hypothetical protein GC189_06110 [Alphaproteobacteria bacterium]|nr:hypothetical protein [Alphaproteobacteria bacterium]